MPLRNKAVKSGSSPASCSARAALESAIRKCRIAQWEVFDACMDAETRKMMGDDLLNQMAELESSLDRAYDRMWKRLNSLPNAGGMARELAAHDSESPTKQNG